jgi:radical SAM superfamily enzyme YgiQ (UPF0313 family)
MKRKVSLKFFLKIACLLRKDGIIVFLDIIAGLPGDTMEYYKKTVDFAIKLCPREIQIKQFFLSPETLFFEEKKGFGIKTENFERDFDEPYVIETKGGINKDYFKEVLKHTLKKTKEYPTIKWSISTSEGGYLSPGFYIRF